MALEAFGERSFQRLLLGIDRGQHHVASHRADRLGKGAAVVFQHRPLDQLVVLAHPPADDPRLGAGAFVGGQRSSRGREVGLLALGVRTLGAVMIGGTGAMTASSYPYAAGVPAK